MEFVWDRDKFDGSGERDPGIKFGAQESTVSDQGGVLLLLVFYVAKPREIKYRSPLTNAVDTHMVVPGMVVESIQGQQVVARATSSGGGRGPPGPLAPSLWPIPALTTPTHFPLHLHAMI
jgi:hypothetical protein